LSFFPFQVTATGVRTAGLLSSFFLPFVTSRWVDARSCPTLLRPLVLVPHSDGSGVFSLLP